MRPSSTSAWPIGIAVMLGIVVIVNLLFLYTAITHADRVDPTYVAAER
jgi:hypothetical protein